MQEHFIDLCRLLGEPTSAEAYPTGDAYCFERGARPARSGWRNWLMLRLEANLGRCGILPTDVTQLLSPTFPSLYPFRYTPTPPVPSASLSRRLGTIFAMSIRN